MKLTGKPTDYHYVRQGKADTIKGVDDKQEFIDMKVIIYLFFLFLSNFE